MVTSTCVIVWLTISHYIVLAIFGNRDFFLKLHHQCFVFITSWICYNLTPPANFVCSIHLGSVAMSYTCTLWTRSYFCYICIKWIHFRGHLINPWHQHLCCAGRVLLPVYVCIESNKYSFWCGLILPSLAYTICQLLHIMKEYQTCIFIPLDLIFRVLSSITFICFLFILNFLNWFTSITYILNALSESLHAIFQFLKTKYNVFKH